jgi:hypothetical protein
MNRLCFALLSLGLALGFSSCAQAPGISAKDLVDALKDPNAPTFAGSKWRATEAIRPRAPSILKTVSTGSGNIYSSVTTSIPLQSDSVELELKADGSFTCVQTSRHTSNWGLNYISDNYSFSTSSSSYYPGAFINGKEYNPSWDLDSVATIGSTFVSYNGNSSLYPVTFPDAIQAAGESGQIYSIQNITGTWNCDETTDPAYTLQTPNFTSEQGVIVETIFEPAGGGAIGSKTTTLDYDYSTDPLGSWGGGCYVAKKRSAGGALDYCQELYSNELGGETLLYQVVD